YTNGSIEFDETVSTPIGRRPSPSLINPVLNSFGNSLKLEINCVFPFSVFRLIIIIPPITATKIPIVADVIASDIASSQPYFAYASPTAAAVPCPPTNPAPSTKPNPTFISVKNNPTNNSPTTAPPPHIITVIKIEYDNISRTRWNTSPNLTFAAPIGTAPKINAINKPGYAAN